MAAVMRNLRCERFYLFVRLFNESGISLSQRFTLRSTFSTSTCKLYSKTLPFLAKKWEAAGTTDHDFARPRTSGRDDLKTRSRSNNRNYSNEEDDSESDSESEDEEDVGRKSGKLKQKTGKAAAKIPKLSQKSGHTKSLRPSKYLFRDRGGWNEEKQWEGRQIPEDSKGKAGWYARQMSRLTHEDKIDEALELFSSIKEEKVALTVEIFNVIISSYAKKGKVREAFKLYNDIKKRSLQPTPHTYTSLFNACTKSLSPQHALENVEKLLTEINTRVARDDLEMNVITYNAAIQAVTVCGDPFRAFELHKEMKHNNIKPDGHTFSSLLTACSFDKIEGPSVAMEMLEEMKSLKIKPDIYIFNCILKIMRDFKVFLQGQKPELPGKPVPSSEDELSQATEGKSGKSDPKHTHDKEISEHAVITQDASNSSVEVDQNTREQSNEGLKLHSYFPGAEKFIQMMAIEDVYPDVRTFQLLLYLTSSKAEEEFLMELMESCNISPDVPFFNTLVKRNALAGDLQKAKEHMKKLEETFKVSPSEKSYQTLARGCTGPKEGLALLDKIQSVGITSAQSVYGTLIAGAAKQRQFTYLVKLVKRMTSDGVEPNDRIMTVLERTYSLPCKKPYMKENTHRRLVKEKRFRYVEQKGFQSFFENWKEKAFRKKTASKNDDDDVDDYGGDDDDITDVKDSKFSHL